MSSDTVAASTMMDLPDLRMDCDLLEVWVILLLGLRRVRRMSHRL